MNTNKLSGTLKAFTFIFIIYVMAACNTNNKNESNNTSTEVSKTKLLNETVPDSIVQFLITSAATDFHTHQPPTPIDFRNVEIGYLLSSTKEKQYLLCGEFLPKEKAEKNEWETFATIKTSGYEHYLGGNKPLSYCQDAIKILTSENTFTTELKNKLDKLQSEKQ